MGCVFSQADLRRKPGLYKVFNVDDQGNEVSEGYIDIHGSDLILLQEGREPIRWPLRCLRRYGYEEDLFSFESGRRCPTGAGIYAFKCDRTESLFTNLQESINRTGQDDTSRYNRPNPVNRGNNTTSTGTNTTNGSMPRQSYTSLFACRSGANNQQPHRQQQQQQHDYMNGGIETISMMRLRQVNIVELPEERHDYMNTVDGGTETAPCEDDLPYENVELGAAYCNIGGDTGPPPPRPARDCNGDTENAINYIQLIVGNTDGAVTTTTETTPPADRDGERYAKIDFAATEALSKSNIQSTDEGCRRTRHNGTLT